MANPAIASNFQQDASGNGALGSGRSRSKGEMATSQAQFAGGGQLAQPTLNVPVLQDTSTADLDLVVVPQQDRDFFPSSPTGIAGMLLVPPQPDGALFGKTLLIETEMPGINLPYTAASLSNSGGAAGVPHQSSDSVVFTQVNAMIEEEEDIEEALQNGSSNGSLPQQSDFSSNRPPSR